MGNKKYAVWWFFGGELKEQEEWLTNLASQGWHLKSITAGVIATFVEGDERKVRYRCEVADRISSDQIELYRQGGWEYVDTRGRVHIFRAPEDASIPELHTDPIEQSRTLLTLVHNLLFGVILLLALWTISLSAVVRSGTLILRVILEFQWTTVLKLAVAVYLVVQGILGAAHVYGVVRRLRRGSLVTTSGGYQRTMSVRKTTASIIMTLFVLAVAGDIGFFLARQRATSFPPVPESILPVVKLGDFLEYAGYHDYEPHTDDISVGVLNHYRLRSSLLAPAQHELYQTMRVPSVLPAEDYYQRLYLTRYDTRHPALAQALAQHLVRVGYHWGMPVPWSEPDFTEYYAHPDGVTSWSTNWEQGGASVILRGNTVVYVMYHGAEPLDRLIELITIRLRSEGE